NKESNMRRGRSLARRSTVKERPAKEEPKRQCPSFWVFFSWVVTFYAPPSILRCCGMPQPDIQQAWREKMALVTIIMLMMGAVGFLTFGFQQVVCGLSTQNQNYIKYDQIGMNNVIVNGRVYDVSKYVHPASSLTGDDQEPGNLLRDPSYASGMDLSFMFQTPNGNCKGLFNVPSPADAQNNVLNLFPCVINNGTVTPNPEMNAENAACHLTTASRDVLRKLPARGDQYFDFEALEGPFKDRQFIIYSGSVLDMGRLKWLVNGITPIPIFNELADPKYRGRDVSFYVGNSNMKIGRCLQEMFRVGALDTNTIGCIASEIVLYVSLIVILGVVFIKFGLAVVFGWGMGPRLGRLKKETPEERHRRIEAIEQWSDVNNHYGQPLAIRPQYTVTAAPKKSRFFPKTSRFSTYMPGEEPGRSKVVYPSVYGNEGATRQSAFISTTANSSSHSLGAVESSETMARQQDIAGRQMAMGGSPGTEYRSDKSLQPRNPDGLTGEMPSAEDLAYTILLVTCYSEGGHGIRTTLDSLAGTYFPTSHKCLFIICDGIITGAGESVSTPDVCLSMMKDYVIHPDNVQPYSYLAIADGTKRHNMAKIYAGYYSPDENSPEEAKRHRVPMVLVVKCGSPAEANERKPGNRGKRDSQIILMSFLQHVMFDERMTELEYELFNAMWNVTGVTPDNFEIVLMVDADTKVFPDAIGQMVATMVRDPQVMGLCGETKIANKSDSWVSMIQVFEYYISHHQSKAFESVFGGVTCLPGCFCMYRIKAPKGAHGYWVPILANPDIVENYSENVVDTLHKKNLLLLGEDRYLSTLMLRTFPKRKMVFVPGAVCKTIVPDEFKVLLSQRRRWINSTVHNLMELVLVRDLCGTFFFSMQFVIFMELVGTVVLPAAITFTLYLIIISTFTRPVPWLPLMLLAMILGLPAVLITLTSRKMVYVGWMLIYLLSLPVWNFVLPAYAFWHFDDFSWGQTRMVEGEGKEAGHGDKEGEFDSSKIVIKRWCEFEAEKRRRT
ncbi:chitin synthase-domain-containing protein, partial [Dimargaris cristalligena]